MENNLNIYQWTDVMNAAIVIARRIIANEEPIDCIVGVSRGGMIFATLLSELLQRGLYSISVTRRVNGIEQYEEPYVRNSPSKEAIINSNVLLVDEIIVTGKTMMIATSFLKNLGAKTVKTCAIVNRSNGIYQSDYIIDIKQTDCTIFPWDFYIMDSQGKLKIHPEYLLIDRNLSNSLYGGWNEK